MIDVEEVEANLEQISTVNDPDQGTEQTIVIIIVDEMIDLVHEIVITIGTIIVGKTV
jgi:hypothetical protein